MHVLSATLKALNPFTRIYMVTYLPALAALLLVHEHVVALDGKLLSNTVENNFMIILIMLLSIHVAQLPGARRRCMEWSDFWDVIRLFYFLALAAAALRLGYLCLWTMIGIFGSDAHFHYLLITLAPWVGLPFLFIPARD